MIEPSETNDVLPWVEKYRPKNLNSIISQHNATLILRKFLENNNTPHLLLNGPSGSGKTSAVLAYARELYGSQFEFMVLELNASDERGIEIVRTRIKQFVSSNSMVEIIKDDNKLCKLVILDEIDAMTNDAQSILRKIIEQYTYNARFCLICNYINKINDSLQSRCTIFRFTALEPEKTTEKLKYISVAENIKVTDQTLTYIADKSDGDMRKAINIIQSAHILSNTIDNDCVNKLLSIPSDSFITQLIDIVNTKNINDAISYFINIKTQYNYYLLDIVKIVVKKIIRQIMYNEPCFVNIPNKKLYSILQNISTIEHNLSICTNDFMQSYSFISLFYI